MKRALRSENLGEGQCTIDPLVDDADPAPADAKHTLLASYPGSGKRFTWTVIKALTNTEVADDWNYSEKLGSSPLTVKTSWPHKEGIWSWGSQMDQVILLIRNPRWAIPSYHNMRFELDYASDQASSLIRVPYTYTERPAVALWEAWRDAHFDVEMTRWANFIDFWMYDGRPDSDFAADPHPRCVNSDINCNPVAIIDFDLFYGLHAMSEYFELKHVLETSVPDEIVASSIRRCVFDKVVTTPELHQGNRTTNVEPTEYLFTEPQLAKMLNITTELRNKYDSAPWSGGGKAENLAHALNEYVIQIQAEYDDLYPPP